MMTDQQILIFLRSFAENQYDLGHYFKSKCLKEITERVEELMKEDEE